ncbi:MAG TPA: hypothetical protein VF476_14685 [Chitinophagaceae bacterium]
MSELIHEGSHVIDNLLEFELRIAGKTEREVMQQIGNNWQQERRAYFYERQFQAATGMKLDFDKISELKIHIEKYYSQD